MMTEEDFLELFLNVFCEFYTKIFDTTLIAEMSLDEDLVLIFRQTECEQSMFSYVYFGTEKGHLSLLGIDDSFKDIGMCFSPGILGQHDSKQPFHNLQGVFDGCSKEFPCSHGYEINTQFLREEYYWCMNIIGYSQEAFTLWLVMIISHELRHEVQLRKRCVLRKISMEEVGWLNNQFSGMGEYILNLLKKYQERLSRQNRDEDWLNREFDAVATQMLVVRIYMESMYNFPQSIVDWVKVVQFEGE